MNDERSARRDVEILQIDLRRAYTAYARELDTAVERVMRSGWYLIGKELQAFEQEWAEYLHVRETIGVANGTDAVELCLRALGLTERQAVIVPSHTAAATVTAVIRAGATPVFCDLDERSMTLDPVSVRRAIEVCQVRGFDCRAIIAVHLYGHPVAVDEIESIVETFGLVWVEDAAQAHGASYNGRHVGGFGQAAAFSFYPTKNLAACGDGGAVVTNDSEVANRVRQLRQYGWNEERLAQNVGQNSRLDELQAAILRVRLRSLDSEIAARNRIAQKYIEQLSGSEIILPEVPPNLVHAFHQFVIRVGDRESVRARLLEEGIATAVHYPVPLHKQPAFAKYALPEISLSRTEQVAREVISLPMHPWLTETEVSRVCQACLRVCKF